MEEKRLTNIKTIVLAKRCENAYDIYLKIVSTLTYAPNCYVVYKNGRIASDKVFSTIDEAESWIIKSRQEDVCLQEVA